MNNKNEKSGYGMFTNFYWVVILGLILGGVSAFLFKGDSPFNTDLLLAGLAVGIALAYLLLSIVDWFAQLAAFKSNPLPHEMDLSDRSIAGERLASLQGNAPLFRHIRRLLSAWASGAPGPQVAIMADTQLHRSFMTLGAETAAIFAILCIVNAFMPPPGLLLLSSILMVLIPLISIARFQLTSHLAGYIESNLLAHLGAGAAADGGVELAQNTTKAVTSALASLTEAQAASTAQLASAQEKVAANLAESQTAIAKQLDRVAEMAASIDRVLKLQESVDGALKGVSSTSDFTDMLATFKKHLESSDELLRNVVKPRTIRLVESDPQ